MSIKDLFIKKPATFENSLTGSKKVESADFVNYKIEQQNKFIPQVNFASASEFSKYGSAYEYYTTAIQRIYNEYPYDGSEKEKILFELSSSYLDKYIFDKRYPKTTGYISFSKNGTANFGWGAQSSTANGYGLSDSPEYIYSRGGMHTASAGMADKPLYKTFDNSVVYDTGSLRSTTYDLDLAKGFTVEFWMKRDSYGTASYGLFNHKETTKKEVILDLWNGETATTGTIGAFEYSDYGRFTLVLEGTGSSGQEPFKFTLQSGSLGVYEALIGSSNITTGSFASWHHYALTVVSDANGITTRLYQDGNLDQEKIHAVTPTNPYTSTKVLGRVPGLVNAYIGALQGATSTSGSESTGAGKLSSSLDEFRFWKEPRTSEQIYNNWYRPVGGGTNTDDANTTLGVYYKFNEGVLSSSSDSIILDYSGRIANGTWTGYSSAARHTGSAFEDSGLVTSEPKDPIIYSENAHVNGLLLELQESGSAWDLENTSLLYNTLPTWLQEEDAETTSNVKYLYQIIASYFDSLHAQITAVPNLKNLQYPSASHKALPFADRLLEEKGFVVPELFIDSDVLEYFGGRDANKIIYEKELVDIKNTIYTNIYNNLINIYKSKGTEQSIRNTLRCFGIDDELIKLNIYTDGGTHYFNDRIKHSSVETKYINFNETANIGAVVYQTASINNTSSFISGSGKYNFESLEKYSAFTSEIDIIIPKKLGGQHIRGSSATTGFITSSIFGMYKANYNPERHASHKHVLVHPQTNFQVYLQKRHFESNDARFLLTNHAGKLLLTSSYFDDIYDNQRWNLAVRVKPQILNSIGSAFTSSNPKYDIEFYGVHHSYGDVMHEFTVSTEINGFAGNGSTSTAIAFESGSAFLSDPKRFYVGAHRTDFTGSIIYNSDIQVGALRYYLGYVNNDIIKQHNLDPTNYGLDKSYESSLLFFSGSGDFANTNNSASFSSIPAAETLALHWNFQTVTGANSNGQFTVQDFSSGSQNVGARRYGWIDDIILREHEGVGFGFQSNDTAFVKNEHIYAARKELPETNFSSDNIYIKNDKNNLFIDDDDVSDNFFSLEKSMYQVISDEMINTFSTIKEFNNLVGKAVDRYRIEYKNLNLMRRLFFERVTGSLDFDRFTEYFKWIDASISRSVEQLFPASARFSSGISDVVESHILERNKYQSKLKLTETWGNSHYQLPAVSAHGIGGFEYKWRFGHAPIDGVHYNDVGDNTHCVWQKHRKERITSADAGRTHNTDRENIKNISNTYNNELSYGLANEDLSIYQAPTFALRRFSRLKIFSADQVETIHGGTNYSRNKRRDYVHTVAEPHGRTTNVGIPVNVIVVGPGDIDNGIEVPQQCNDVVDPNRKEYFNIRAYSGKYSGLPVTTPIGEEGAEYLNQIKGAIALPFNIVSASVTGSSYNRIIEESYKKGIIFTNLHSDTTSENNEIPMQGPFTETWVGGHQARHVELNKYDTTLISEAGKIPHNNLHDNYTREEAYRILFGESFVSTASAFGIVGPDYGGPYPDPSRKIAKYYRNVRTKRPINIANIRTLTSSNRHGNFKENYEIVQTFGKKQNNIHLRRNPDQSLYLPSDIGSILPETTHPMSLVGVDTSTFGNVFGRHNNNRQPDSTDSTYDVVNAVITSSLTNTVISSRFSSPGGPEVNSLGYLDAYSREYSVHNNLNYRNLTLRRNSGEASTIRLNDHLGKRDGVDTHRSRHSGKFGLDSVYGAGTGVHFNGTSSFIDMGPSTRWNGVFGTGTGSYASTKLSSWSMWYHSQTPNAAAADYLFNFDSIRAFVRTGSIFLQAQFVEHGGSTKTYRWKITEPTTNAWHHLAITYDANTGSNDPKFYIDGVEKVVTEQESPSLVGSLAAIDDDAIIGSFNNRTRFGQPFKGYLSEFAAWNEIITRRDVELIYANGPARSLNDLAIKSENLQAWYKLGGEGDSSEKYLDYSGHARHSTQAVNTSIRFIDNFNSNSPMTGSKPSLSKQHRNISRRPQGVTSYDSGSIEKPKFKLTHDNEHVTSTIPRSDFQYSWVNNTLGQDYSIYSGKQRIYGYAPKDGILSSSVSIEGNSGFVEAITFPSASDQFGA